MKRLLACLMLVILLVACVASLFPITALAASKEDYDWLRVSYALKTPEGVAEERTALTSGAEIAGGCVLYFDDTKARVVLDDHAMANGTELTMAGEYELKIYNLADEAAKPIEYNFKVLPDINVYDGQVFTEFPQINYSNATKVTYAAFDIPALIASGERIQSFGRYTVTAYGKNKSGNDVEFKYTIYVRMVHAVQVEDPEKGHALNVIVGSFEGHTVEATLDDTLQLQPGNNLVTEVGTHTLNVKYDGVFQPQSLALPDANELSLRIPINFASKNQKTPYYFDFTGWNATVKLDGKPVSGEVRMAKHGKHTLEAFDKDGNKIENAFAITEGKNLTVVPTTTVEFKYINPHFFIAIGAGVVALGFGVFAAVLFLARRRLI